MQPFPFNLSRFASHSLVQRARVHAVYIRRSSSAVTRVSAYCEVYSKRISLSVALRPPSSSEKERAYEKRVTVWLVSSNSAQVALYWLTPSNTHCSRAHPSPIGRGQTAQPWTHATVEVKSVSGWKRALRTFLVVIRIFSRGCHNSYSLHCCSADGMLIWKEAKIDRL